MSNVVITQSGANTIAVVDGTTVQWVTADATYTAVSDTVIKVELGGVELVRFPISGIVSIDGTKPYGNATDVIAQIEDSGGGGGLGYLVYTALLTQSGTDAPVATVLGTPTITGVTYGYDAEGSFYIASADFTEGKTFFIFQPNTAWSGTISSVQAQAVYGEDGYPAKMIYFNTLSAGVSANNWVAPIPVKIEVSP